MSRDAATVARGPVTHRPLSGPDGTDAQHGAVATHWAPAVGLPIAEVAGCQLVNELASGGHAVVYRGWQPLLHRYVAIKALTSEAQSEPALVDGFLSEARLLAQFAHPNLPQVHDLVSAHAGLFMVMELCDGVDLQDVLARQPVLPWPAGLAIFAQAAKALAHVHRRRVVHADIKPANLILTWSGLVKLVDFGLAQRVGDALPASLQSTPAYQSPEQVGVPAGPLHPTSDQYSLALVLQQMLTGTHIRSALPSERLAHLPEALTRLLARCLAPDPSCRFFCMEDVVTAAEALVKPDAAHRDIEQVRALLTLLQQPAVSVP